ncbi:hypothetical protein Adt_22093 [Abeliophyllum distichum]|uniref:Uncharacterized protein n=1 Tax=Abeliophyllum distichum TaxID=126358 RepID=A0ABD1T172_9LAMI
MRGSLDQRNAPAAQKLNEELKCSATEASMDWNLAPCQITPNGWGQMIVAYLLWRVIGVGGDISPKEFESIYRPCRSVGWYNISSHPSQKRGTSTDSPNKVHNWKDRFFFVGGGWEFLSEDPCLDVSTPQQFGNLDCRKPPILKKKEEGLRVKWEKVRALDSDFRSLNNLLQEDDLLIRFGLMDWSRPRRNKFTGEDGFSREPSSQGLMDSTLLKTVLLLSSVAPSPIQTTLSPPPPPPPLLPSPPLCSEPQKDKEKEVDEHHRGLSNIDGEDGDARNSAGSDSRVRISHRSGEMDPSILEPLPTSLAIIVASVYKYWTQPWEKTAEEALIRDLLRLAEMNLVRGLVLTKEVFNTLKGFDGKLAKEEANLKKLSEELKAMSSEKAQLESEKKFLQVRMDTLANKGDELKAKYEVELAASKECLKDARTRKRAAEAQKLADEAHKLVEDKAFAAETALATANSALEALVAEKDWLLAEAK